MIGDGMTARRLRNRVLDLIGRLLGYCMADTWIDETDEAGPRYGGYSHWRCWHTRRQHRNMHGPNYWHRFNASRWRPGGPVEHHPLRTASGRVDGYGSPPRWSRRFPHQMVPTRRRERLIVEYAERQHAARRAQRAAAEFAAAARPPDAPLLSSTLWDDAVEIPAAGPGDCPHEGVSSAVDGDVIATACNTCGHIWTWSNDDLTALADEVFAAGPAGEVVDLGGGWRWRRDPNGWSSVDGFGDPADDGRSWPGRILFGPCRHGQYAACTHCAIERDSLTWGSGPRIPTQRKDEPK